MIEVQPAFIWNQGLTSCLAQCPALPPKVHSLLNISLVSEGADFKGLLKGVMMHSFRNDYFKSLCFMEWVPPIFIVHGLIPNPCSAFQ